MCSSSRNTSFNNRAKVQVKAEIAIQFQIGHTIRATQIFTAAVKALVMLEKRASVTLLHPQSTLPSPGESSASETEGSAGEIEHDRKTSKPPLGGYGGRRLPERAKKAIAKWSFRHVHHPKPSHEQKEAWKKEFGIERRQIDLYCINFRQKVWKPQLMNAIQLAREKKSWKGFLDMLKGTPEDNPYRAFIGNISS